MSRIEAKFKGLADRKEKALICFLTAGYPSVDASEELIVTTASAGADVIEIGIPFSDPLADGPSIQAASQQALELGMTLTKALDLIRRVRNRIETPIVLMTYFNPVNKFGIERFSQESASAGADGVIMTDMPPEEAGEWKPAASSAGLDTIFLLAPTSTDDRIRRVAEMGTGFIYCVSRTGVTGAQSALSDEVGRLVERIRSATTKPVAVGFGVSGPEQVREITKLADGAVVGSALINLITEKQNSGSLQKDVHDFVSALKQATR